VRADGDGWVRCATGHRHWGRFGAAGLLLRDGHNSVLQHRAPWTHQGDTWGLPGGAMDSDETPVQASLRESSEEAGIEAAHVRPIGCYVDDHGGWSYTTVVATPLLAIDPRAANAESIDMRWWADSDIERLTLHTGFAITWPLLRPAVRPLTIVVDALAPIALESVRSFGIATGDLPLSIRATSAGLHRLYPRILFIGDGPEAVTACANEHAGSGEAVVVVTQDSALREALASSIEATDPNWLWSAATNVSSIADQDA
jgi:8-oxo-dGTP diphosphatase